MARKKQKVPRRFLVQTVLPKALWSKAWKTAQGQGHTMSGWLRHLVSAAVDKDRHRAQR